MSRWAQLLIMGLLSAAATPALAAVIHVSPGTGTTLQAAIDSAADGDTIRVHAGLYEESIEITKPLKLIGDSAATVTISAGCSIWTALSVLADNVVVKNVSVTGGIFYAIDIQQHTQVMVTDSIVNQSCGSEQYGLNVHQSTRIHLARNQASGYGDAGIYIGAIPADGHVSAVKNTTTGNLRGFAVEDSEGGGVGILIMSNVVEDNSSTGILIQNSDNVRVIHNFVSGNVDMGILMDMDTDDGRVISNRVSGSQTDVVDQGLSNCWKKNLYVTGTLAGGGCP